MNSVLFTKIYRILILAFLVLTVSFYSTSCEKDKKDKNAAIIKYLLLCPAGSAAACKAGCIDQYDADKDGAVEDSKYALYSSCTSSCDKYCEAALFSALFSD